MKTDAEGKIREMQSTAVTFLQSPVEDAPNKASHREMYERGLNEMIVMGSHMGCKEFAETSPERRIGISAGAIVALFNDQEKTFLLACAVDRLTELALDGQSAYRYQGDGLEPPKDKADD